MKAGIGAAGRVRVVKHKASGEVIQELEFDNAVLDSGMRAMHDARMQGTEGPPIEWFRRLWLGTGTTEPSRSDTGLEARSTVLGPKDQEYHFWQGPIHMNNVRHDHMRDDDNYIYWLQVGYTHLYGEGEAEGVWTELGLSYDTNYTYPMTRALFRDENGQPTSLTVLSDEFLSVYYDIRLWDNLGEPKTGTFTFNGTTHTFTMTTLGAAWSPPMTQSPGADGGVFGNRYPFATINSAVAPTVYSKTYDIPTNTASFHFEYGPTTSDQTIDYFDIPAHNDKNFYKIELSPPITKRADYRVTLDIDLALEILGDPVTGIALSAADAVSLTFTWDAYPNATTYHATLRQAGTLIESQVITAPTTSATFSGLAASTEYHMVIYAETSGADSARDVLSGSTAA